MLFPDYAHSRKRIPLIAAALLLVSLSAIPFVKRAVAGRAEVAAAAKAEAVNAEDQVFDETVTRLLNEAAPGQSARRVQVLIELSEPPVEQAYRGAAQAATAQTQAREQARKVELEQKRIAEAIAGPLYNATELYRVRNTVNAIAAVIDASRLSDLRKLPGVKRVSLLALETTGAAVPNPGTGAEPGAQTAPAQTGTSGEVTIPLPAGGTGQRDESIQVLVELNDAPAARIYAEALKRTAGTQAQVRAAAAAATRSQMTVIRNAQQRVGADLSARIGATEIYRVQKSFNGIAVRVAANQLDAIRKLPGVRAVHPLVLEFPTNSTSVPFIGAPQVWANTLGTGAFTGSGIKVGIIDTGIDYQHANFGGTGALADYQANDRTAITETGNASFPTAKVAGGFDFAGDAYTGSNAPAPDPDPMDCNGHGSHVAGSAAGFGVNADGTPFAGPFNTSVPFASLRIGPGVAPQASLYALRVFGCGGGTAVTIQAIDWAVDPNGDLDFSDHLDVINMSLGSSYGMLSSTTAVASDNAALAGVIVVASAGNSGDTFFITGSPGSAQRGISVAAVGDSGLPGAALTVNSPPAIAGSYVASSANSFTPTPAPTATVQTGAVALALDAADGSGPLTTDGCTALTNVGAVIGNIALIDRGTCGFQVKAANAQAAGAIGVIVVNNVVGEPANFPTMAATAGQPQITIPVMIVSSATGDLIKAQLGGGVNATLAAVTQGDTIASFSSRGSRLGKPNSLKPDVAAPGVSITSSQTGVTCTASGCQTPNASGFLPNSQTLTISGTSMAAPHVAGVMALLRQQHADWTVEELKALVMNTALNNVTLGAGGGMPRIGLGRAGAGRVDPQNAVTANVVAFNADDAGSVSLSFAGEIAGVQTSQKSLRLVNKGTTSVTYDLGIQTVTDAPGVSFSLPNGGTVTVPAGGSVVIPVQMDANSAQMDHTKDASVSTVQTAPAPLNALLGNLARHFLTEEGGYVNLSIGGSLKLRVPVYASVRPASMMSAPATIATGGAPTGSTTIALSGSDVCTGTLGAGPVCTGTFPAKEVSLVTPFEWQVSSPRNNDLPDYADIKSAGVAYDATNNLILFGVASQGDWASPTQLAYNIYVDFNEDGTWDRILFNSNPGTMASSLFGTVGATGQDAFINGVFNIATNGVSVNATNFTNRVSPATLDTALFNNNVMFLAATPAQLGLPGGDTTFRYKVVTRFGSNPLSSAQLDEAAGPYFWNYAAQGLNFNGTTLAQDLNGAALPVTWNTANMTTNGSLGALLLHHHNTQGKRDEVVVLEGTQTADLAVSKSVSNPTPTFGTNVTFTITVSNSGPNNATGVVVSDLLPAGLVHVSDNGAGAYSPVTGLWTVGNLANAASATLQIVATVNTTDRVDNTAAISASSPADPNPANNQATVSLMAPRSANLDLAMSVSSPTVTAGNSVTFTLTVKNIGDDPAYSINVTEDFPSFPALNPGSFTASQGVYNPATGLWNLASLGKGFTATLTYTVNAPNTAGPLTNQATGTSTISDPNTLNNSASATTVVCPTAIIVGTPASGALGQSYNSSVAATPVPTGGFSYQYSLANATTLPPGLTLNTSTGAITGTPTADGNFSFDIKVELFDAGNVSAGCATATQTRTINVTCVSNPVVTNLNDSGAGSLRDAIDTACAGSTITFAPGLTGTITLTSGDLIISRTLTIQGPGAQVITISGNQQWRIFTLFNTTPASLSLSGLSLRNGNGQSTVNFNQGIGGAVYFSGTPGNALTLTDLTIADNTTDFGGGVYAGGNTATITVLRSTIAGNVGGQGGGMVSEGNGQTVNLMRSTFSGNTASSTGGGIAIRTDGTVNVVNCTIAGNQASNAQGGGIGIAINVNVSVNLVNSTITNNQGGGLQLIQRATANVRNTLLALNGGGDAQFVFGGTFISSGYNLFGTGVPADAVQATDQVGVDPLLELDGNGKPKLAFNGGPTQTIRLLPGSPAIDRGGATPFNEAQLILLQAGSGTYTLTFNGQTTNSLPFDATAAQIQTALNALSTIGGVGGNITVSQTVISFFNGDKQISSVVSFGGTLSGSNQPLMTAATADSFFLDVLPVLDGGPFSAQPTDQRGQSRPYDIISIANASGGDGSDIGAHEQQCATITLSSLPNGTANAAYNQALNPGGGFAPYSITLTAGTLPPGLAINGSSLSGVPTATGTFNFTLTATDAYGCTGSQSYSLTFACAGVTVLPATLPGGSIGTLYNQTVSTSPTGAFTFSVTSGALPPGLLLNSSTGAITGTPTTGGTFNFTIQASTAGCSGSNSYAVTIGCQTISLTPASLPAGQAGVAYSQALGVTPSGSYTFAISTGNLPSGLTLNPSTGVISGLPSATGTSTFTVQALTANGCLATQSYTLAIGCPVVTVNPASLPNGATGSAYSQTISALPAGGSYTYAVTSGSLPAGLNLNPATGLLSGTPSANGTFTFTVTANGFGGCTGSRSYTVTIGTGGCPTVTLPATLPNGSVGTLYSNSAAASPSGSYTYSATGSLPPGTTLYTSIGLIFGYPTAAGSYTFTITATAGACSGSKQYTVVVGAGFASSLTVFSDFDGDGKSDLSVFRGTDGSWLVANSGNGQLQSTPWGSSAAPYYDLAVSGDYDGDGKTDQAVFRRGTDLAGYWFIKRSSDGQVMRQQWGLGTDVPVAGDYDGDGKTDIAVWRGSAGAWYILRSSDGGVEGITWGIASVGDIPVPGDYDGDFKTDVAVFRRGIQGQQGGDWHIKRSSDGSTLSVKWGVGTDVPVAGDYDGDGKTDLAVWRAAEGNWYIVQSSNAAIITRFWATGSQGDVPVPGDFDGDGKADFAVWNEPTGTWLVNRSHDNSTVTKGHGQIGDVPILARRN